MCVDEEILDGGVGEDETAGQGARYATGKRNVIGNDKAKFLSKE